jgi:hypothetical protein
MLELSKATDHFWNMLLDHSVGSEKVVTRAVLWCVRRFAQVSVGEFVTQRGTCVSLHVIDIECSVTRYGWNR